MFQERDGQGPDVFTVIVPLDGFPILEATEKAIADLEHKYIRPERFDERFDFGQSAGG